MKLSVILPSYNEKENIGILTDRLYKVLTKSNIDFELIYIIQGLDGTKEELTKIKNNWHPKIKIFHYKGPLGIGGAFKEGFSNISQDATHVLTMDCDLNHQPEEIPLFIDRIEKQPPVDIVIGSRNIPGGKLVIHNKNYLWIKKILSNSVNFLLPWMYGLNIKDITSGYRLFKFDVIKKIRNKIRSKNFEVYPEILILSKRHDFKMAEVPIVFKEREHGKSKLNFYVSAWGYSKLFFRLMFNNGAKGGI